MVDVLQDSAHVARGAGGTPRAAPSAPSRVSRACLVHRLPQLLRAHPDADPGPRGRPCPLLASSAGLLTLVRTQGTLTSMANKAQSAARDLAQGIVSVG